MLPPARPRSPRAALAAALSLTVACAPTPPPVAPRGEPAGDGVLVFRGAQLGPAIDAAGGHVAVYARGEGGRAAVHWITGGDGPALPTTGTELATLPAPRLAVVGDLDSGGRPDLALVVPRGEELDTRTGEPLFASVVFVSTESGDTLWRLEPPAVEELGSPRVRRIADVDGDGQDDVLVADRTGLLIVSPAAQRVLETLPVSAAAPLVPLGSGTTEHGTLLFGVGADLKELRPSDGTVWTRWTVPIRAETPSTRPPAILAVASFAGGLALGCPDTPEGGEVLVLDDALSVVQRLGAPEGCRRFGTQVIVLDDVSGDGLAELAVAAPGVVFVIDPVSGDRLVTLRSDHPNGQLGATLLATDTDGDGAAELWISEPDARGTGPDGVPWRGRVWCVSYRRLVRGGELALADA